MARMQEPPHNIELEQQILGAVLGNNDLFHRVGSMIKPDHFFEPFHSLIWHHVAARVSKDHIASPVTLMSDLGNEPALKELGGAPYLARMVGAAISSFAIQDYARELVELSARREIIAGLDEIANQVNAGGNSGDAVSALELLLADRDEGNTDPRSMSLLKAHTRSMGLMSDAAVNGSYGIPTGLPSLDEMISFRPKRYTILGGNTSMGKTALAIFILKKAAEAGYGAGFVSLEMGEEDLANRISSIDSQVPYKAYDRPMSEALWRKVIEANKNQQSLPVEIMSAKVRDVPAILSEGKRLKQKWAYAEGDPSNPLQGFKLLVIDYIQLVRGRGSSEFHVLSQVANDLKQIAKQLDVHVIALAQLDRKLGEREDPRPRLSDLRGSGDLEQAPDNVLFIYRPEYYLERQLLTEKNPDERINIEADLGRMRGKAEIIIGKARMGDIGILKVNCDMATNRFWDIDHQEDMF